jgi:hypothetical protein
MRAIELVGQVDAQHRLTLDLPPDIPPGPVKVLVQVLPAATGTEEDDWQELINDSWAEDWSDPRDDIYTLDEGKANDDAR